MLSVTREKGSGLIVLTSTGVLDEVSVEALLRAIALTPEEAPIVIDLSRAEKLAEHSLRRLAYELAQRPGPVSFRGSAWGKTSLRVTR
ncbi:MAG: hypothetical protein H6Q89_192 [Myxococcaceae bacterium]|nr:hypothetical protein [Myxococcaceae bacterium]